MSKSTRIASYFADFGNEASVKDGLKLRCKNVKLFLREPLGLFDTNLPDINKINVTAKDLSNAVLLKGCHAVF